MYSAPKWGAPLVMCAFLAHGQDAWADDAPPSNEIMPQAVPVWPKANPPLAPSLTDATEPERVLPPAAPPTSLPPLRWNYPSFSNGDYAVTAAAAALTLTAAILPPLSGHKTGGVLFDGGVRNSVRFNNINTRYIARDISDVGLSLAATWPIFVDSLVTAWWFRGSRKVAQEMALIDLETLAITGAAQGVTNVLVSRERPYSTDCGSSLPSNALDCNGSSRFRSFFSGHSAFSFASAALICTHHFEHQLLGAPYDGLSCAVGYAVAATTATMRVMGDMHYATDVITGMLIGTAVGYGVPLLHYRHKSVGAAEVGGVRLQLVPAAGGAGVSGIF